MRIVFSIQNIGFEKCFQQCYHQNKWVAAEGACTLAYTLERGSHKKKNVQPNVF